MTPGTPTRSAYRPVSSAAREGEHTVQFARIAVNSMPSLPMRSMFGVWASEAW
jgi:hypothetical protein